MMITNSVKCFLSGAGALLFFAGGAIAGADKSVINDKNPAEYCKENPCWCDVFDGSTLFDNEDACLIQKVSIVGRYHGQHLSTDLDINGTNYESEYWEHRRFRLGVKVQFLNDFTFYNDWNIPNNEALTRGDFFDRIQDMWIKWEPSRGGLSDMDFWVMIGKQKQLITREFEESSKYILSVERSHIVNEVAFNIPWGITFGFEGSHLEHSFGIFTQSITPQHAWPDEGYASALYKAVYELNDNTTVHFDYLYSNRNAAGSEQGNDTASFGSDYTHVFSLGTETEWDLGHCDRKAGLVTDFIVGRDRDDQKGSGLGDADIPVGEDTYGFVFLPYYDLTQRLQLVGKYAFSSVAQLQRPMRQSSNFGEAGSLIPRPNLEDIHTTYVGLNYHICDHQLKVMGGYEYLSADLYRGGGDVDGGTWMLGVRTYW